MSEANYCQIKVFESPSLLIMWNSDDDMDGQSLMENKTSAKFFRDKVGELYIYLFSMDHPDQ